MARFCNVDKGVQFLELLFFEHGGPNWIKLDSKRSKCGFMEVGNKFYLSSLLGASRIKCLGLSVRRKSVKIWSNTLKHREFNKKLEIKDMIMVWLALNLFIDLILSPL